MAFTFDPILAVDPNNPAVAAANASITLFNPSDAGKAPITITDVTGSPLPNPITVNRNGFGPAFQHPTLDRVGWHGGGFTGYFTSYEGMKAEAVAARSAAQTAAANAGSAAAADLATRIAAGQFKGTDGAPGKDGSNVLPTDTAIEQAIKTPASKTATALNATIQNPSTDINLLENFGQTAPKILRVRSSSTPGTGVGANAGRSAIFEVADSRAKSMIDYRFPLKADGSIWDFRDGAPPEDSYKSVAWMGVCHYWAQDQPDHNNPTDLHNHISILEMPDQNRELHTIFDSPIGSHADPAAIGSASHRIRTNRSDFVVRVGNPYDAALERAYRLKVTAAPEYEKFISFHANTSGSSTAAKDMSGVRWEVGVPAGLEDTGTDTNSNFVIQRYTDSGFSQRRSFLFGERKTGKVTFGKESPGMGQVNAIWQDLTRDGFYAYPELGLDASAAPYAAHVGSTTNKVFRALTGSTSPAERFHILGDGKLEWGNSTAIDTNLYRSAASTLATDDDFEITLSTKGLIQKSPDGTRYRISVANGGAITATAV